jgi:hypothetical protein
VARGELSSLQFGRRLVVPCRAIERLLDSCEDMQAPDPRDASGRSGGLPDLDQFVPTIDHDAQPMTNLDHAPDARNENRETGPEQPARITDAHAQKPTHTPAPRVRGAADPARHEDATPS